MNAAPVAPRLAGGKLEVPYDRPSSGWRTRGGGLNELKASPVKSPKLFGAPFSYAYGGAPAAIQRSIASISWLHSIGSPPHGITDPSGGVPGSPPRATSK